ncbi:SLC13 family permease [Actinoplanes sp. NPDC051851]|uniref:SLC13 family permease n=1 Tax=Actinoplanes sp. NPDC051851 TaxID=3154753 RepID=UPI0034149470
MSLIIALSLLGVVLAFAVARPRELPEAVAAVPAALLAIVVHLVSPAAALSEVRALAPTVLFLAAVLVLAFAAERHGVFAYVGEVAAERSGGSPRRLLTAVFAVAAVTTAVLSLDATVVLLTPVVFAITARVGVRPRPHVYACNHLANSASLLLPVSNLTNLLAFAASGLTFAGFAALMAVPWVAVVAVEYLVFRLFFAKDLAAEPALVGTAPAGSPAPGDGVTPVAAPRYALGVLAATLAGFGVLQPLGVEPAWVAAVGALALGVPLLRRREVRFTTLLAKTDPAFCAFVLALGVVVLAVRDNGLGDVVNALVPSQAGLFGLLGAACLAAILANLLNNLPATLVLIPAVAHSPGLLLAVLIGVNVGPNLTYVGSLATLLWRRILTARGAAPRSVEFHLLSAITVPLCLVAAVVALWAGLRISGV